MTAAELAQAGLLWLAGNLEIWRPLACMALLTVPLGVVHLLWALR